MASKKKPSKVKLKLKKKPAPARKLAKKAAVKAKPKTAKKTITIKTKSAPKAKEKVKVEAKKPAAAKPSSAQPSQKLRSAGKDAQPAAKPQVVAPKAPVKMPAKRAYQVQVGTEVLPPLVPHVQALVGRTPSVFKDLGEAVQPKKVEDGRVYLVEEEADVSRPSLIEMQIHSYHWFLTEGLRELLEEISPITDFSGKKMELRSLGHTFDPPKYDPDTCRRRNP
ncbi:MAG: hypothetical protein PHW10_02735, partial [Candidatus Peribacteraceae bacterium]|nr:hypothetical protein [Candidatus Peribacteraceae bacterium]